MRVLLGLVLVILTSPTVLLCDSIDFTSVGGTIINTGTTLSTTAAGGASSTLVTAFRDPSPPGSSFTGSNMGTVDLVTGALISGSISSGGSFGAGGLLEVIANGTWGGIPAGDVIFLGDFIGATSWTPVGSSFVLSGPVAGTYSSALASLMFPGCSSCSVVPDGSLVSLTVSRTNPFGTSGRISSSDVNLSTPEPAAFILLGTGLVGLAGIIRRRFTS